MKRLTARFLNKQHKLGAAHALHEVNGRWYHLLQRFPGALFDAEGVVIFKTESAIETCSGVKIGPDPNQLHVKDGISSLPGYKVLEPPPKTLS